MRLGIDAGKARVGIAQSDPEGMLATPVLTLQRTSPSILSDIKDLVEQLQVVEIIVGLPLNLSGAHTASTADALSLARQISETTELPVVMVDERLTTVSAHSALREVGKKQRGTRSVIDQVAAVMVLQHWLDAVRSGASRVGKPLEECEE